MEKWRRQLDEAVSVHGQEPTCGCKGLLKSLLCSSTARELWAALSCHLLLPIYETGAGIRAQTTELRSGRWSHGPAATGAMCPCLQRGRSMAQESQSGLGMSSLLPGSLPPLPLGAPALYFCTSPAHLSKMPLLHCISPLHHNLPKKRDVSVLQSP